MIVIICKIAINDNKHRAGSSFLQTEVWPKPTSRIAHRVFSFLEYFLSNEMQTMQSKDMWWSKWPHPIRHYQAEAAKQRAMQRSKQPSITYLRAFDIQSTVNSDLGAILKRDRTLNGVPYSANQSVLWTGLARTLYLWFATVVTWFVGATIPVLTARFLMGRPVRFQHRNGGQISVCHTLYIKGSKGTYNRIPSHHPTICE